MDVLQAEPRRPVPALRHRPARGAALPRLPDADRDPARGRSDGDARGRLVLPARRRRHGLPHRPREVDDHRGVDRRGRQGAAVLPQHRLPRAVRRGLRQALRDVLRRRPPPDLRRAGPVRRGPGARPATRCAASPASCSRPTWPAARPRTRSPASPPSSRPTCPRCSRGRRRTTTPTPSTTRGWSAPRWSCWPATCAGCSRDGRARRPRPSSTTSSAARRCCCSGWPGSAPSTWPAWSRPMAEAYAAAVTELDSLVV